MLKIDEEIKNKLKEQGYANRKIDYQEFLQLYEPYKNEINEVDFANILGISYPNLYAIKTKHQKATILKNEISVEITKKIKNSLIKQGFSNCKINYQEFLQLYEPYKNEIKEFDFANILGISDFNLYSLKNRKTKTIILKTQISSEKSEQIKNSLIEQGFSNRKIDYQEFLQLYEPYKNEMKEADFANILGISYPSSKALKSRHQKVIILKTKKRANIITEERKNEIKKNIINQGYSNRKINYQEFLHLYEPYKNEMKETDFADILGILPSLYIIKNKHQKATILKTQISIERKEEIRNILIKQGNSNKQIDYQKFLQLYTPYKNEMTEVDFASILNISYNNFLNIKNTNSKTTIFKTEISIERKEEIKNILINYGYSNRSINYQEFLKLYEPYKNEMKESDFANILGISYPNLSTIRNTSKKARILKTQKSLEKIEEIKIILTIEQKYSNSKINYQEFLQLYEPYKNKMKEADFANILGISNPNFYSLKNKQTRARILKQERSKQIIEELKNEIEKNLIDQGYSNRKINYQEFLQLYEPYKNIMSQLEFSKLLLISLTNFYNLQFNGTTSILNKNKDTLKKIEDIVNLENRYYIKKELDNLCKQHNITTKELILYLYKSKNILENFNENGIIYIGECKIDKKFQQKYANNLLIDINNISEKINKSFFQFENIEHDIASDTLFYILTKKGDIILNSPNDQIALKCLKTFAYKYIKMQYLNYYTKNKKISLSLDETISNDSEISYHEIFSSEDDIEKIVDQREEKTLNQENIITEMKTFFDGGLSNQETMNIIMKKYNLNKEKLLKILKLELAKKNKLKTDKKGSFYLGEEL